MKECDGSCFKLSDVHFRQYMQGRMPKCDDTCPVAIAAASKAEAEAEDREDAVVRL